MRFILQLHTEKYSLLPFNYQYPLSAAIYNIIQRADHLFAAFLHDSGYGKNGKFFKLFTFSDIKTPFQKQSDRMQLLSGEAELIICFLHASSGREFIKGLFMNQQLEIADSKSKVRFTITQVESLSAGQAGLPEVLTIGSAILLQPLSPLVVGRKNERGHYDYRSPEDSDFVQCLYYNWMEKCAAVGLPVTAGNIEPEISIEVLLFNHPPQQRLITIKAGTDAETKIRGYTKFRLAVTTPVEMLEVALGAGLGLHNAQGMGCVEVVNL